MDRFQEALNDAEKCIEINADFPRGYQRKATALKSLGRLNDAINAVVQGLSKDIENKPLKELHETLQKELEAPA